MATDNHAPIPTEPEPGGFSAEAAHVHARVVHEGLKFVVKQLGDVLNNMAMVENHFAWAGRDIVSGELPRPLTEAEIATLPFLEVTDWWFRAHRAYAALDIRSDDPPHELFTALWTTHRALAKRPVATAAEALALMRLNEQSLEFRRGLDEVACDVLDNVERFLERQAAA